MGKLLPVIIAVVGLLLGAGAGFFLRPAPDPAATAEHAAEGDHAGDDGHGTDAHAADDGHGEDGATSDFVKMNNQFVIPVVESGRVASLVILSLSLEVGIGGTEQVYKMEPKLRDSFLQVLFNHANVGGFRGAFTDTNTLDILRYALQEAGQKVMGETLSDVLIVDIVRQDSP